MRGRGRATPQNGHSAPSRMASAAKFGRVELRIARVGFSAAGVRDPASSRQPCIARRHLARNFGGGQIGSWNAASTQCVMPQSAAAGRFAVNHIRCAPSKRVRGSAMQVSPARSPVRPVDARGPSARLRPLKAYCFREVRRLSAHPPRRLWRHLRRLGWSRSVPPWTQTGTPMKDVLSLSDERVLRVPSTRAYALHSASKLCMYGNPQRLVETPKRAPAFAPGVRHGSCLLVQSAAVPVGGGVNEEMAA